MNKMFHCLKSQPKIEVGAARNINKMDTDEASLN
jgi:hypothetical protein